jgi:hypothetical protein
MALPARSLLGSLALVPVTSLAALLTCGFAASAASATDPGVAVLLVDTDRVAGTIDERIYGQFLEEINHSVVDGLYAEQVRGQGFDAQGRRGGVLDRGRRGDHAGGAGDVRSGAGDEGWTRCDARRPGVGVRIKADRLAGANRQVTGLTS